MYEKGKVVFPCTRRLILEQYVLKDIWQYLRRTRWETLGKICQDHVPFIL